MFIKYFNQRGNHIDKSFQKTIQLENKYDYLDRETLLFSLEKDEVNINDIQMIRYFDEVNKGWRLFEDETLINVDDNKQEINLIIKISDFHLNEHGLIKNFRQLSQILMNQEKKFEEIESIFRLSSYNGMSGERNYMKSNSKGSIHDVNKDNYLNNYYSENNHLKFNNEISQEICIDLAFIYSNPLYKIENNNERIFLDEYIDYEKEIDNLVEIFKTSKKKFSSLFQVGTLTNIKNVLDFYPRILHISCDGSFLEENEKEEFFLNFEDKYGGLEKIRLSDLKNLQTNRVQLVIIQTYYSEIAAYEIFKSLNIPAIVSLHSDHLVSDVSNLSFTKKFYESLMDGKTIKSSFKIAKDSIVNSWGNSKIKLHCCCFHRHKPDCKWKIKERLNRYEAHLLHLSSCRCKENLEFHYHKLDCIWARKYLNKLEIQEIYKGENIKVCCCNGEIEDNQFEKFRLIIDENYENTILFPSLPNGSLEILNSNFPLDIRFNTELKISLIGRNKEFIEALSIINNSKHNNRLLTIHGKSGMGKEAFVRCLGSYLYERKFFEDGIHFIQSNSHIITERELISEISKIFNLHTYYDDVQDLFKKIDTKMLLIYTFPLRDERENMEKYKNYVERILEKTKNIKFIIISEFPLNSDKEYRIHLQNLDNYYLAKMLNLLAADNLTFNLKNNLESITKDELIKTSEGNPGKIIEISFMLQDKFDRQVILDKIKRKQSFTDDEINVKIKELLSQEKSQDLKKFYDLIYVLTLNNNGLLESDFLRFFKPSLTFISSLIKKFINGKILINERESKELKTYVYEVQSEYSNSVNFLLNINITNDDKISIYKNLLEYYSIMCRKIITNLNDNVNFIDFSAFQNYGMWLSLNIEGEATGVIEKNFVSRYKHEKIYNPVKYYIHIVENIKSLIDSEIFYKILEKINKNYLSFEIKESIEQLSICIPSILKSIGKLTECTNMIKKFMEILTKLELNLAKGRLKIFSMSLYPLLSESNVKHQTNFDEILKIFKKSSFYEGVAESYFCKAVTNYHHEKLKSRHHIPREHYQEIVNDLETSLKFYEDLMQIDTNNISINQEEYFNSLNKSNISLGYARVCYVLSDYQINKGNKSDIYLNYLKSSEYILEKNNKPNLYLRCKLSLCKWHINKKNYFDANDLAEKVVLQATKLKKLGIVEEANQIISNIKDLIQMESQNIFVFMKAHQLVYGINFINSRRRQSDNDSSLKYSVSYYSNQEVGYIIEEAVEPIVTYPNFFRKKLIDSVENLNKEILLKFDVMTKKSLTEILHKGGRFLHISSDFFTSKNSLYVEGEYGETVEITGRSLEKILNTTKCLYEVVIISIPQSRKIGEIFLKLGVPHVICFDFDQNLMNFLNKFACIPITNILNDFSINIITNLLTQETIEFAFNISVEEYKNKFYPFIHEIYCENISFEIGNISPLLLPKSGNHNIKFSCRIKNEEYSKEEGKIMDVSKLRNQILGINKSTKAIIGRKKEIYFSIKVLLANTNLNIYGDSGLGRTTLVKEISNYLNTRQKFKDGIFYLDLNQIESVNDLKELLQKNEIYSKIEKNKNDKNLQGDDHKMLLVFDNCDRIIRYNENQFFILIFTLGFDRYNSILFLLVSNKKLINPNFLQSDYLRLDPLSKIESSFLFINSCKRKLERKEIDADFEDNMDILEHISASKRLNACRGYPLYIRKLAVIVNDNKLNKIDYKNFLPTKLYKRLSDVDLNDDYRFQLVCSRKNKKLNENKLKINKSENSFIDRKKTHSKRFENHIASRKISNIESIDDNKHNYKLNRKKNFMKKRIKKKNKKKTNKINFTENINIEKSSQNSSNSITDEDSDIARKNSNNSHLFYDYEIQADLSNSQHESDQENLFKKTRIFENIQSKNNIMYEDRDSINYQLVNSHLRNKFSNKNISNFKVHNIPNEKLSSTEENLNHSEYENLRGDAVSSEMVSRITNRRREIKNFIEKDEENLVNNFNYKIKSSNYANVTKRNSNNKNSQLDIRSSIASGDMNISSGILNGKNVDESNKNVLNQIKVKNKNKYKIKFDKENCVKSLRIRKNNYMRRVNRDKKYFANGN